MKGLWGSSVAALLVVASSGALAADMARPMVMAPPVYNWTGLYIGGNLGGAWETGTLSDSLFGGSISNNRSGFIGGGQVGYNWQLYPQFVLGVEWMFDGTDISSNATGPFLSASQRVDGMSSVAARFGYAVNNYAANSYAANNYAANNWLFYGKAGGGWVHDSATLTSVATGFSVGASDTKGGWLLGAGIEYGFTPNWTMRLEYDHLGLDNVSHTGPFLGDTVTLSRHFDMLTVGLNYKFSALALPGAF
jgi:outer membrane immunogenic protein